MSNSSNVLELWMRYLLLFCGPMNLAGAICFIPPVSFARRELGLPEPHPFYLWLLSSWILAFGVAYFYQGWTGQANRAVLAMGVWGKGGFAGILMCMSLAGELPVFAAIAPSGDLLIAVIFAIWLWRHR